MLQAPTTDQRFKLTASVIASHFKHRCDRLFRWNTVEGSLRGKPGIGWNIPARVRRHSRPGIIQLMQAGDEFEIEQLENLEALYGEDQVFHNGIEKTGQRSTVRELPLGEFLALLQQADLPRFIAQIEIDLSAYPGWEAGFLEAVGLDPEQVKLGIAKPDLVEVIAQEGDGDAVRLRIWDFKASQVARHEHFMQVAFYALLLEHVLRAAGLANVRVDMEYGVVRSRDGEEQFELEPYRLAVADFLRHRVPELLATLPGDAHFHVQEKCALCEYMTHCRDQADVGQDLSRIAYISSESKRRLLEAGFRTHRDLVHLGEAEGDQAIIDHLKATSHDLSVNLYRYIAAAQALEDGRPRPLEATTLLMPLYEEIRVVFTAEQDAVTGTCFALGFKTYEGWDTDNNRPISTEAVFVAEEPDTEATLLLDFLRALNGLLQRVDEDNRAIREGRIAEDEATEAAQQQLEDAEAALQAFKDEYPRLYKKRPEHQPLLAQREALTEAVSVAKRHLRAAERDADWARIKAQERLHFYVYDSLDLLAFKSMLERHLFSDEVPDLLDEIRTLVRLFPPESVLPDAESFRTMPGTIVTQVLRTMVALPVPYQYELREVSAMYQPRSGGYTYRPRYGFAWSPSNQVAFERIHDVWERESFRYPSGGQERVMTPDEILSQIQTTLVNKLRATDAVVRRLKQDLGDQLRLKKEPFRLYDTFDPTDFRMLEALRIFTLLETSLEELEVKQAHTLPASDRAAKFICIRNLQYIEGADEADGSLWFTFDHESRDAKFDEGDFLLALTPEDEPERLLGDVDGALFDHSKWRHRPYQVTLMAYDLGTDPPRVLLKPDDEVKLRKRVDLSRPCVLDRLHIDFNSRKVFDVLERLQAAPEQALHVHELIATGTVEGWTPVVTNTEWLQEALENRIENSGADTLNTGQWAAFHGAFREPLTLVWGPPGTGKTHTIAHTLLGYALAAERDGISIRILVTAFTHHAIVNVLKKVSELAAAYGLAEESLHISKVGRVSGSDARLPSNVGRVSESGLAAHLDTDTTCIIVGATVWSTWKAADESGGAIQPFFDVVLVDEASQMKLPDALLPMSVTRTSSSVILAGDDRQLPPIIHGTYPEEHEHMLTSVFAFMRHRMQERVEAGNQDAEQRMLFQLEENFRMNEPLTAYPRDVLYRGFFRSNQPDIRISTEEPIDWETDDPIAFMLHPERPVVLISYKPPRSFTARNPIEANLIAHLVTQLSNTLLDGETVYSKEAFAEQGLAVLSPHRAQNSTIRQTLLRHGFEKKPQDQLTDEERPMPLVDTVDKLQGQERDVILVSYGVADGEYAEAEADFLLSSNRFNVAATRARQKLIVFCSEPVLNVVPTDQRVLLDAMMLKEFRSYCNDGNATLVWQSDEYGPVDLQIQWKGFAA